MRAPVVSFHDIRDMLSIHSAECRNPILSVNCVCLWSAGRCGAGQTQETHELMCDDCDSLVLAPEEKRHRPSALSYAEHDPPTANVTLFSRRAWNMADLAEELGELRRPSQLPPLRAFRRSVERSAGTVRNGPCVPALSSGDGKSRNIAALSAAGQGVEYRRGVGYF